MRKPHHAAQPPPPPPLPLPLPPRNCPLATAVLALLSVLLATALWVLLVLSPASHARGPAAGLSDAADAEAFAVAGRGGGGGGEGAEAPLSLGHIVFGIAGSAHLWPRRREYVRMWWDPAAMRGHYDWREMVYVGAPSESHSANTYFSHSMAFGGGGVALSLPLATALARTLDVCIERYPKLYGSDDRLHACITELGVPLSREYGFHQWDIRGNAHGILAAHPIAPFISIHHLELVDPIYPGLNSLESLELFTKAMKTEPMSFLQRSICYDKRQKYTFAVSLGYVVQVYPYVLLPRELERSERTYIAYNRMSQRTEFDFDTKDIQKSLCKKPILFFLKDVWKDGNITRGSYIRASVRDDLKNKVFCFRSPPLPDIDEIQVSASPLSKRWHLRYAL
uniref:Uncharacterized protein n=1 Tax=Oryza barthii TaxID=65489 RepID=A0A0D3HFM6_9ORYZ